ncbi:MAG: acyl-CoA dehydrogenase family protein [Planctomycetota bacterium]
MNDQPVSMPLRETKSTDQQSFSELSAGEADVIRRHARQHLFPRRPVTGFDPEGWRILFETGLFALLDTGRPAIRRPAFLLQAAGRGGADRGLMFAAGAHYFGCLVPIARQGTQAQKQRWLPALQSGQQIGCLAITELSGGTEQSDLSTRVTADADGLCLTGVKRFVTNVVQADVALVIAAEFPQRGSLGLSALLVPLNSVGVTRLPLESHGLTGAPAGILQMENVQLSASDRLGPPGAGLAVMLSALQAERSALLAGFLGAAEFDLALCYHYLLTRFCRNAKSGGEIPQVLRHRLAEIRGQLMVADALFERGLVEAENSRDALLWPAVVKKTMSETVVSVADEIHRIYAGLGWLNTHESATAVLDTRAVLAASGTSEVMLNMIWTQLPRTLVPWEDISS